MESNFKPRPKCEFNKNLQSGKYSEIHFWHTLLGKRKSLLYLYLAFDINNEDENGITFGGGREVNLFHCMLLYTFKNIFFAITYYFNYFK